MNTQPPAYLVGLIGDGVGPSLTPPMHMAEGLAQGLTYLYRPIDLAEAGIAPDRIGEVLARARDFGFNAVNVTHPCKQLAVEYLDEIDPVAAALGAVNTVLFTERGLVGHNTDTTGFARGFTEGLPGAELNSVVLVGAGGAGAAVADALLRLGTRHLAIVDTRDQSAEALAREVAERHSTAAVEAAPIAKLATLLEGADGIVHATPSGMAAHPGTAFDTDPLQPRHWVADIVYRPLDTELLRAARARGCRTLDGGHMAVFQAVDAFGLITGRAADPQRMARHFRSLVADLA